MKIRAKIILAFLALSEIVSTLLLVAVLSYSQTFLTQNIGQSSADLAQEKTNQMERELHDRLEQLKSFSNELSTSQALLDSNSKAWDQNKISQLTKTDYFGSNSLSKQIEQYFNMTSRYSKEYGFPVWSDTIATNQSGFLAAKTGTESNSQFSDQDWWLEAKSKGAHISDIAYDQESKNYSLIFSSSIKDSNNNFLGVVKTSFNPREIFATLSNLEARGQTNQKNNDGQAKPAVELISKKGEIIFSTAKDQPPALSRAGENFLAKIDSSDQNNYFIARFNSLGKEDFNSKQTLFSYADSKGYNDFPNLNWTFLIERDTAEVFAPAAHLRNIILIIMLVIVVVVVLSGYLFSGLISKPIERLFRGTKVIEQGNLDYKVGTNAPDEIGQLSRAFDHMTAAIKRSRADVDRKVEEQTKEISEKADKLAKQRQDILHALEDVQEEKDNVVREKAKIDTIVQGIGDGVFVVDANYKIVLFNEAAELISGMAAKDAIGQRYDHVLSFALEDGKKGHDKFVEKAIESGKIAEMSTHTVLIRKDKTQVPVSDSAAPLKNKNGKVNGCVVVFRDVTKEREIDKAKTEFVSLASHQLRTPLSAISWYTEMLLTGDAGKLKDEQIKYLQEVYNGNKRMIELVNSLLNVSRIELGTFAVDPESMDIVEIAKSVINELKPQMLAKHLGFEEKYAKIPKFNADPKLMRMILQNFLSNSVKYTPEKGKVGLSIELKKKGTKAEDYEAKSDSLLMKISDNGYGIPKKQQDRIFSKLFRADNVRAKETEGTGLGLYIIKSIVDHSQGKTWFESEENKGTTFHVLMPLDGMKKKEGAKRLE